MHPILAISLGGALGALSRHYLSQLLQRHLPLTPPWTILLINLLGCFLIGLISAQLTHHRNSESWHLLLITGFLGSFTTYSTFALHSTQYLQHTPETSFILHLLSQIIFGLLACLFGLQLSHWLNKP